MSRRLATSMLIAASCGLAAVAGCVCWLTLDQQRAVAKSRADEPWPMDDGAVYRFTLESKSKQSDLSPLATPAEGHASVADCTASGAVRSEALRQAGRTILKLSLQGAQLACSEDAAAAASNDHLEGNLYAIFKSDGAIDALVFSSTSASGAERVLTDLVELFQSSRGDQARPEEDAQFKYLANYQRSADGQTMVRTMSGYSAKRGVKKFGAAQRFLQHLTLATTGSGEMRVHWGSEAWPDKLSLQQQIHGDLGTKPLYARSKSAVLTLTEHQALAAAGVQGLADAFSQVLRTGVLQPQHGLALESDHRAADEARDRDMLAGQSYQQLRLRSLQGLSGEAGKALKRQLASYVDLYRASPELTPLLADLSDPKLNADYRRLLVSAVAAERDGLALTHLVPYLNQASIDRVWRLDMVAQLAFVAQPSAALLEAVVTLLDQAPAAPGTTLSEAEAAAYLSLGTMANVAQLNGGGGGDSDQPMTAALSRVATLLHRHLASATSDQEATLALGAIGNMGSPSSLPILQDTLAQPRAAAVHRKALFALRFIAKSEAETLLQQNLQAGDEQSRAVAQRALALRHGSTK